MFTYNSATVTIAMQISKMINTCTLLHKPVIPIIIEQLPCAHMACLQIRKPKMTKTDFLEIKISTAILIWNGRECFDQVIYEII